MDKTVVVSGDLLVQEHLFPGAGLTLAETNGGAWRLARLAELALPPDVRVIAPRAAAPVSRSVTSWKPDAKGPVWRIDRVWGVERHHGFAVPPPAPADILLLHDLGLGFADTPTAWPDALLNLTSASDVVLCCEGSLRGSKLWDLLLQHPDRVTVVVSAARLRTYGAALTAPLSWDRTIEEVVREFDGPRFAASLARLRRVVVQFDSDGAASFTRQDSGRVRFERCLYDPARLEGPGLHDTALLGAALARHAADPESYPLYIALSRALRAMRVAYAAGGRNGNPFEAADPAIQAAFHMEDGDHGVTYYTAFPHGLLDEPALRWQPPTHSDLLGDFTGVGLESAISTGVDVVLRGVDTALAPSPKARFGKYVTVDRDEIERINSVRNLIVRYIDRDNITDTKPLAFAVFGPPGSGKSFAVKQLIKEVVGDSAKEIEFNLSQFQNEADLHHAFHCVRDATILRKVPFVFWDEFDTEKLRWLKSFLAPIQDSKFFVGGAEHAFGKAVFIFAGGTKSTFAAFDRKGNDPEAAAFRDAKGPDFVSRLRGHIDVKGPNPDPAVSGQAHIIRRAVLLRGLLQGNAAALIDQRGQLSMDACVTRAFLTVDRYLHGARSLEALVTMSNLRGVSRFGMAELPSRDLQQLHVSDPAAAELGELAARRPHLGLEEIELLAKAAHNRWKAVREAQGYVHGAVRDDHANPPTHPLLVEFESLPPEVQEGNRTPIRAALVTLGTLGYRLAFAGTAGNELTDFSQLPEADLLRAEHDRWLRERLQTGWAYAERTNVPARLHRDVAHFTDLPPGEGALDRATYETIIEELPKLGYALAKG